jgi:hypothetical protein
MDGKVPRRDGGDGSSSHDSDSSLIMPMTPPTYTNRNLNTDNLTSSRRSQRSQAAFVRTFHLQKIFKDNVIDSNLCT